MGLMDILIDEINKDRPDGEKFERMHSEQFELIKRDGKTYHIRKGGKSHDGQRSII